MRLNSSVATKIEKEIQRDGFYGNTIDVKMRLCNTGRSQRQLARINRVYISSIISFRSLFHGEAGPDRGGLAFRPSIKWLDA